MRMHPDEVDTDAALVRRLLAGQFPRWAELPIVPVEPRGTDNALYRLGSEMVVRLPRRERTVATLVKEYEWLPFVAPQLPLDAPVPLALGAPQDGYAWPWAVFTWLEGDNAPVEQIGDLADTALDLARFLLALHRVEATGGPAPGKHNFLRGAPLAVLDPIIRRSIAALDTDVDAAAIEAAWDVARGAPEWDGPPVWVHGDLDVRNLLVREGRIAAVVDFGCLGVGDPACDVAVAWKVLSPGARGAFREALSVDEATWARARGWVLYQVAGALSYYTPENNPALVNEASRWLAEVD